MRFNTYERIITYQCWTQNDNICLATLNLNPDRLRTLLDNLKSFANSVGTCVPQTRGSNHWSGIFWYKLYRIGTKVRHRPPNRRPWIKFALGNAKKLYLKTVITPPPLVSYRFVLDESGYEYDHSPFPRPHGTRVHRT